MADVVIVLTVLIGISITSSIIWMFLFFLERKRNIQLTGEIQLMDEVNRIRRKEKKRNDIHRRT